METIKIKSTHPESQGDFVVINAADFNPAVHEAYEPEAAGESKPGSVAALRAILEAAGVPVPAGLKKADLQAMVDSLPKP